MVRVKRCTYCGYKFSRYSGIMEEVNHYQTCLNYPVIDKTPLTNKDIKKHIKNDSI
jgi:hypothetical protein